MNASVLLTRNIGDALTYYCTGSTQEWRFGKSSMQHRMFGPSYGLLYYNCMKFKTCGNVKHISYASLSCTCLGKISIKYIVAHYQVYNKATITRDLVPGLSLDVIYCSSSRSATKELCKYVHIISGVIAYIYT